MKFARYLEETQTPEWKRAYIDYRGLKKRISVIQAARKENQQEIFENADKSERRRSRSATPPASPHKLTFEEPPEIALRRMNRISELHFPPGGVGMGRGGLNRLSLRNLMAPLVRSRPASTVSSTIGGHVELLHSLPLHEILPLLSPLEVGFFTILDQQLEKVESFYCAREEEMLTRGRALQLQLKGLKEHRNLLLLGKTQTPLSWTESFKSAIKSRLVSDYPHSVSPEITRRLESPSSPSTVNSFPTFASSLQFPLQDPIPSVAFSPAPSIGKRRETEDRGRSNLRDNFFKRKPSTGIGTRTPDADSDRYLSARRKLKRAVLEHYRGLELLDNYRIMNQTGFRKILKKFEKHTKMPVQDQYMSEKVEKSTFSSSGAIKDMMKQMEEMFAVAFLDADNKKATTHLRTVTAPQTHHLITFRVGLYLGLAVPALIDGLYKVSQQETRDAVPTWEVLLYLYGALVLPVLFALLVGLNLAAWASARINYVFIFELDVLSRIDHRRYFEIPAFLFTTLIYCFWFTFGVTRFHPTSWPLIWFLFAIVVIINPLPVMQRSSRYWFLRSLGKQFLSGTRPVDFTDFWMGDQLCSMTFTMSHLATFFCAYAHHFQNSDQDHSALVLDKTCGTVTSMWGVELALLSVPQAIRLIQSVKRYADSPIYLHLVNAGKYATGIIYSGIYLKWRQSADHTSPLFALWCLAGVFSSLYGCAWDLKMDWSLLNRHTKYPLLRSELLYPNHVPLYYFAIVTNILGRFSWLLYVPKNGPDFLARTFLVALLELLRRFQWNFLRLENEHLGNVDQYRVTREVPLPYPRGSMVRDEDEMELQIRAKAQKYRT